MEVIEQYGSKGTMIVAKGRAKTSCIGVKVTSSSMKLKDKNFNLGIDKVCAAPENCTSESA